MNKPTLADYSAKIKGCDCKWCRQRDGNGERRVFIDEQPIEYYQHDHGWPVDGMEGLQWLYVTCPECRYQWSLSKLGVPR